MITTSQLAEEFETGLNELLADENMTFHLWAEAGNHISPTRDGNTVNYVIEGTVAMTSSSMSASRITMGVNHLTIVFGVPVNPPKTTSSQPAAALLPVKDRQLWYVIFIMDIISRYFSSYKTFSMTDSEGDTYEIGMIAGVSLPQSINLDGYVGNFLPVNVYADCYIVKGGINSMSCTVAIDGVIQPFTSFTPERAGVTSSDVHSGEKVSKTVISSTAFAAQAQMPANTLYQFSDDAAGFLFGAELNKVHFMEVTWGSLASYIYLVLITKASGGVEGVTNAAFALEMTEAEDNIELLDVPDGFQVGYFELSSSDETEISFTVPSAVYGYIAGTAYSWEEGEEVTVTADSADMCYDSDAGTYRVYLITSAAVTLTDTSEDFEVV